MTSNNFQGWQKLQRQSLSYKGREKSYLFQGIAYAVFCHFKTLLETSKLYHQSLWNGYIHSLEAITFIIYKMCFVFYFCFSGWHHQVINLVSLLSQQDKIMLWSKFTKTVLVSQMRKFGLWYMMVCKRCDKGRGDRESKSPASSALHSRLPPLFAWTPTFSLFSLYWLQNVKHCFIISLFSPTSQHFITPNSHLSSPTCCVPTGPYSPDFPPSCPPPCDSKCLAIWGWCTVHKTTVRLYRYLSVQFSFLLNTSWNNVDVEPS